MYEYTVHLVEPFLNGVVVVVVVALKHFHTLDFIAYFPSHLTRSKPTPYSFNACVCTFATVYLTFGVQAHTHTPTNTE